MCPSACAASRLPEILGFAEPLLLARMPRWRRLQCKAPLFSLEMETNLGRRPNSTEALVHGSVVLE